MFSSVVMLLLIVMSPKAFGQEKRLLGEGVWYGGLRSGYLYAIDSEGRFFGRTQSVYGGSPVIDMDQGTHFGFAIGRRLTSEWWLELELTRVSSQTESDWVFGDGLRHEDLFRLDGDIESTVVMSNLGYDFAQLDWWATPYVRIGLGVAVNAVDAKLDLDYQSLIWQGTSFEGRTTRRHSFPEGDSYELAWSVAAGFTKRLNDRFALRVEYSQLGRGDAWSAADENTDYLLFRELQSQQLNFRVDAFFE